MSHLGPLVIVSNGDSAALGDQLAESGAFPIVNADWDDAATAILDVQPAAVVAQVDEGTSQSMRAVTDVCATILPYTPVLAVGPLFASPGDALPFTTPDLGLDRLRPRLAAALRVRALHATVLRRLVDAPGDAAFQGNDPLHDATVVLVGRGRSYPALTVAFGERVGLIGALSIESAAKHLASREVDGIVLGDGFSHRVAEAFLTVLAEDARFRSLPVIVGGSFAGGATPALPNLEIARGSPDVVVAHAVPLVRQHAFEMRLSRTLKSVDAGGVIDPATGLLTTEAFDRNWEKAVTETIASGGAMSAARFCFDNADARARRDAARILGRLLRGADFASLREDHSIVTAFAETELREAHVIARRLAAVLRQTAFGPAGKRRVDPMVTLATVKPNDTAATVFARLS